MNNSTSPEEDAALRKVPLSERVVEGVLMSGMAVVTAGGHVCLVATLVSSSRLSSYCNHLILVLALTDLLLALHMPYMASCFFVGGWEVSVDLCLAEGFVVCFLMSAHVFTLCSIAYVRYLRYCRHAVYCLILYRFWVPINVVVIWLMSGLLASVPFYANVHVSYVPELCFCFPASCRFRLALLLVLYVQAAFLLLFFYMKVARTVKQRLPLVLSSVPDSFDPELESTCFAQLMPYPQGKSIASWRISCINTCMWKYVMQRRDSMMHEAFVSALEQLLSPSDQGMSETLAEFLEMFSHRKYAHIIRPRRNVMSTTDNTQPISSQTDVSSEDRRRHSSLIPTSTTDVRDKSTDGEPGTDSKADTNFGKKRRRSRVHAALRTDNPEQSMDTGDEQETSGTAGYRRTSFGLTEDSTKTSPMSMSLSTLKAHPALRSHPPSKSPPAFSSMAVPAPPTTLSYRDEDESGRRSRKRLPVLVHKLGDGVSRLSQTSPTFQSSGASFLGGFSVTTRIFDFKAQAYRTRNMSESMGSVRKEEMDIGKTVVAILLSFLLPILPAALVTCIQIFSSSGTIPLWVARVCLLLLLCHVALIPLFYGWTNLRIRRTFLAKLRRLCSGCGKRGRAAHRPSPW